jgi:hypothetical protein
MELINIHSRKDYKKIYELIGSNQAGGTGPGGSGGDGFANNTALKDTYLGKLINGVFKGIGWLWRKSKENFVINRLIAQLVNELMRGVILFCFENNINLEDGKQAVKEGEDSSIIGADDDGTNTGNTINTGNTTNTGNTNDNEAELIKKINELKIEIKDIKKEIFSLEAQIKQYENNIAAGNYTGQDKKNKQDYVDGLKKTVEGHKIDLADYEKKLADLEQQLATLKVTPNTNNIESLKKACEDKYDFNPTGENIPTAAAKIGASYTEFEKLFQQRFKSKFIKIGDKFTILNNKKYEFIEVYDVDTTNANVSYMNSAGKLETISCIKLLPDGFPSFKGIKNEISAFLANNISEYPSGMNEKEIKRMEKIYMNYAIIIALREVQKSSIAESIQFLNEENIVSTIASKIGTSGTVKVKPDEPRAGKVSLGRSIGMKAGISAKVGDILTSRDKKKYKDKDEQLGLDIHSVNLAEIEKTIQKLDEANSETDVLAKVSSYVNPYNLKTIEISAEQLLAPEKTEGGSDNESLRLRWNKEVAKTYAAFTNLMDIQKLHSLTKDGGITNSEKVKTKVSSLTSNLDAGKKIGEITQNLIDILAPGFVNFKGMSNGEFCYYSFLDNKNKLCNASIAPVADSFVDGFGLINITSFFNSVDKNFAIFEDNETWKKFQTLATDLGSASTPKVIKTYLLIKNEQQFPASNKSWPVKVFILNEFLYSNGTSYVFLKKNTAGPSTTINKNIFNNFRKEDYVFNFSSIYIRKFKKGSIFDKWKSVFHYLSDPSSDINFNDFQIGKKPFFLRTDKDMMQHLKKLADTLKA